MQCVLCISSSLFPKPIISAILSVTHALDTVHSLFIEQSQALL